MERNRRITSFAVRCILYCKKIKERDPDCSRPCETVSEGCGHSVNQELATGRTAKGLGMTDVKKFHGYGVLQGTSIRQFNYVEHVTQLSRHVLRRF
jgi:hypothetical protein